jgi:ubiquinone biosynthesis protein
MWVPPAPGLRSRLSNLNRMRQVVQALVRHGFRSLVDQLGFSDRALSDPAPDGLVSARIGRRLALAMGELGPTFVKLGQLLATREDLLPVAVTAELAVLQDHVPPMPEATVRAEIERALGAPIETLFESVQPRPLAAASIGQVHRARTLDGRAVVVKVQRPGIAATIAEDLALLYSLAELLEERVPESRRFDPRGVVQTFAEGLQRELDFRLEAAAYRRMRGVVAGTGRLPGVVDKLSCETVLTLDFLDGRKVTAVPEPPVRTALARQILRTFVRQVLHAGYFHADPHPGNLLALTGSDELALLDMGAIGRLQAETRRALLRLAAAAASRDGAAFGQALLALTEPNSALDLAAYQADMSAFLEALLSRPNLREVPMAEITAQMFEVVRKHGLRTRADSFTLLRAVTLLDGVLRELDPQLDPLRAAAPHILWATIVNGDSGPALSLALSLFRSHWRRSPAFRAAMGAVTGVVLLLLVLLGVWLA